MKAVIPCAGLGTRFLPATKAIPKELFPLIDKPIIHLIAEELLRSGINEIIFVISQDKQMIRDYFQPNPKLEKALEERGKDEVLKKVKEVSRMAKFSFVEQEKPLGNGHAVLCARKEIGDQPFVVNWADDYIIGRGKPYYTQLIEVSQKYRASVVSVLKTDSDGQKIYGIIEPKQITEKIYQVLSVVEKPGPEKALSNLASLGGFLLTPDIWPILEKTKPGKDGEIWLQDAINQLAQQKKVVALEYDGDLYNVGEKLAFLKTMVGLGLRREDLKNSFQKFLKEEGICQKIS